MRVARRRWSVCLAIACTLVVLATSVTPASATADRHAANAAELAAVRAELAEALGVLNSSSSPAPSPALSAGAAAVAQAQAAAVDESQPGVIVNAEAGSPITPGAEAVLDTSIFNNDENDLAAPVTIEVGRLPAGVSLDRADTSLLGRSWSCDSGSATCTLVDSSDGITPAELGAAEYLKSRLWLAVADGASIDPTLELDVTANASPSIPPPDLSSASVAVTFSRLAAGETGALAVAVVNGGMLAGNASETTLEVTNLGPANVGGAGAKIVATGLLPIGSTGWTAAGAGWSCQETSGSPSCTWEGSSQTAGSAIDPLTISFIAPIQPTAPGEALSYDTTVTHTSAAGAQTVETAERFEVVGTDQPPTAKVFANAVSLPAVEQGGTVDVELGVTGSRLDDPSRTVEITTTLPAGWSLVYPVGPQDWTCSTVGTAFSCERSADFGGSVESSTTVQFQTDDGAAVGSQTLVFEGSVSGADVEAPTEATVIVEVTASNSVALSSLQLFRYSDTDEAEQVVDGSPLHFTKNRVSLLGVAVANTGIAPVPVGTRLTLTLELPPSTRINPVNDGTSRRWSCQSRRTADLTVATCDILVREAIVPGSISPRAKLRITVAPRIPAGSDLWPLSHAATKDVEAVDSLATSIQVPVEILDIVRLAPAVGLSVDEVLSARDDGRSGLLEVSVANVGDAPMTRGWVFTVELPDLLTAEEKSDLPSVCRDFRRRVRFANDQGGPGSVRNISVLRCNDLTALPVGASGETLSLPVPAPPTAGNFELTLKGKALGAPDVEVPVGLIALPALSASAEATPQTVSLPLNDLTPTPSVQLDGRASQAIEAMGTWTQDLSDGAPAVTFDGFANGDPASGLTASFVAPQVDEETTLLFQLTLDDGFTSDSATVEVVVEPASSDVELTDFGSASGESDAAAVVGDRIVGGDRVLGADRAVGGSSADDPDVSSSSLSGPGIARGGSGGAIAGSAFSPLVRPNSSLASALRVPLAIVIGSGSWTWVVDPTVFRSDARRSEIIEKSRARKFDNGVFVWGGLDPAPADATVTTQWQGCSLADPTDCTIEGTGDVFLPDFGARTINLLLTVEGTAANGDTVSNTGIFPLGEVGFDFTAPRNVAPPTISGSTDVGSTLAGVSGEWTFEGFKAVSWMRCTGPGNTGCVEIPGTQGGGDTPVVNSTYVVQPEDEGFGISFRAEAFAQEGQGSGPAFSSVVQSGITVGCGNDCYTFEGEPFIDRDGNDGPVPIALQRATLEDGGLARWADTSPSPQSRTFSVAWFYCDVNNPNSCTEMGSGFSHVPAIGGVLLEARFTASGQAVDGTIRSGTRRIPFGSVVDASAPPVAVTPPSISGDPVVGRDLTADPGVWINASSADRTYSWLRCEAADPEQCTPVGVTTQTYEVQVEDLTELASVMRVDVTATGPAGSGTARTAASERLTGFAKELITPPTIDAGAGGPQVGGEVTATPAVWSEMPPTVAGPNFAWNFCSSLSSCGIAIGGADGPAYVIADGNTGRFLRATSSVDFENPDGVIATASANSDVVGPILATNIVVDTDLDGGTASLFNAERLTINGLVTGGNLPITTSWEQTSGPDAIVGTRLNELTIEAPDTGTGSLEFTFTAIDANLNEASVDIVVEYGDSGASPELCEAFAALQSLEDVVYGDIQITTSGGSASTNFCGPDTVITIPRGTLFAYDFLVRVTAEVTINNDGVTLSGSDDVFARLITGTPLDQSVVGFDLAAGSAVTMSFGPDDGSYEIIGALVTEGRPGLLNRALTASWTGATRVAFGSDSDGAQTIAYGSIAWDGSFGDATPVPGQLPEPPAGAPVAGFGGSISTDGSFFFSLESTGLFEIAGTGLDFAGSISYDDTDGYQFTASATVTNLALAKNVVLAEATLSWDGEEFTGDGAIEISPNDETLTIAAEFGFTDASEWSASVSIDGQGSWSPLNGLVFEEPSASGTIRRFRGETAFEVEITAASASVGPAVTFAEPTLEIGGRCSTGDCALELDFGSGVEVDVFGTSATSFVSGTLNTETGEFSASFELTGPFTVTNGIEFASAMGSIARDDAGDLSFELTNRLIISDVGSAQLTIIYDDAGGLALLEIGDWTPFRNSVEINDAWLLFSSFDTTVTIGDEQVDVAANTLQVSGTAKAPTSFGSLGGNSSVTAVVDGRLSVSPLEFDLTMAFAFSETEVLEMGGVRLTVDAVEVTVFASGNEFTTTLSGLGQLEVPAANGGSPSVLDIEVSLFSSSVASVAGTVALVGANGNPAWADAFGIEGLDIEEFSVSIALGFGAQLGFKGVVTLPDEWADKIGIKAGAPITLAAGISAGSSCFGIEIGEAGSTETVLDAGNVGGITATHASLYIAPTGCVVGNDVIAPGLALRFDGQVLQYPIKASLDITPVPLTIKGSLELGDISMRGLAIRDTMVEVDIGPSTKRVAFVANTEIFGATADVLGEFEISAGLRTVEFEGTFTTPDLGGFQLDEMTVAFDYTQLGPIRWGLAIDASVVITVLGAQQTAELTFVLENGRVKEASGAAEIEIQIGQLLIEGDGAFAFEQGRFPTIDITGTAAVDGRQMTSINAHLEAGYLEFSATLDDLGIFNSDPRVSGVVVWESSPDAELPEILNAAGDPVQAQPGDFRFEAANIGIDIAGVTVSADVIVARVDTVFFADIATEINLALDGNFSAGIALRGKFESTGDIELTGAGSMTIGGVSAVSLDLLVSRQGGEFLISGSSTIVIPNVGSVAVSGSFEKDGTLGWLYELEGRLAIATANHSFGTGEFKAYRLRSGGSARTGMEAAIAVNLPDLARGSANIAIASTGDFSFNVSATTQGSLQQAVGTARATLNYTRVGASNETFSFSLTVQNKMKIPGSLAISGEINSGGDFSVTADATIGPWTGNGAFGCSATADGSVTITIKRAAGVFTISGTLAAKASAGCGNLNVGVDASGSFTYTSPATFKIKATVRLVVRVAGNDVWVNIKVLDD